jgi:hypothetical protein
MFAVPFFYKNYIYKNMNLKYYKKLNINYFLKKP